MKTTEVKIQEAINNKTAKVLTIELAKQLKGKKIITKYFGYAGQDGVDEFTVGDLVIAHTLWTNHDPNYHRKQAEKNPREYFDKLTLFTQEGKPTHINGYTDENFMWCSDSDREVYFIEA